MMDRKELHCALQPSMESFCTVARSIQLSHGLRDGDVRFFLVADDPEVYDQVHKSPMLKRLCDPQSGSGPGMKL